MTERLNTPTERSGSLCGDPLCTGHLGKFSSCLTEALWVASLDGGDESTGEVDAHGHYTLLIFPESEDIDISNSPSWEHKVTVPAGWYIVEEMSNGAVYHASYESETEARESFLIEQRRYYEWDNQCGLCDQQREDERSDDILCKACHIKDLARRIAIRHEQARVILAARGIDMNESPENADQKDD